MGGNIFKSSVRCDKSTVNRITSDITNEYTYKFRLKSEGVLFYKEKDSFGDIDILIEVDETYVGGKNKNKHASKKIKGTQGRSIKDKTPVFGMLERGGKVIAQKVSSVGAKELQSIIREKVQRTATIMSDEWTAYSNLSKNFNHAVVNHGAGVYVIDDVYTNSIEGFWSTLKRGIIGIYHSITPKHLDKYVKEFEFRYNTRHLNENERFVSFFSKLNDCRIEYKELIK